MLASVPLIDEKRARVYSSSLASFMKARHALDIELEKKREQMELDRAAETLR
jgi:hypothetical protein